MTSDIIAISSDYFNVDTEGNLTLGGEAKVNTNLNIYNDEFYANGELTFTYGQSGTEVGKIKYYSRYAAGYAFTLESENNAVLKIVSASDLSIDAVSYGAIYRHGIKYGSDNYYRKL